MSKCMFCRRCPGAELITDLSRPIFKNRDRQRKQPKKHNTPETTGVALPAPRAAVCSSAKLSVERLKDCTPAPRPIWGL